MMQILVKPTVFVVVVLAVAVWGVWWVLSEFFRCMVEVSEK